MLPRIPTGSVGTGDGPGPPGRGLPTVVLALLAALLVGMLSQGGPGGSEAAGPASAPPDPGGVAESRPGSAMETAAGGGTGTREAELEQALIGLAPFLRADPGRWRVVSWHAGETPDEVEEEVITRLTRDRTGVVAAWETFGQALAAWLAVAGEGSPARDMRQSSLPERTGTGILDLVLPFMGDLEVLGALVEDPIRMASLDERLIAGREVLVEAMDVCRALWLAVSESRLVERDASLLALACWLLPDREPEATVARLAERVAASLEVASSRLSRRLLVRGALAILTRSPRRRAPNPSRRRTLLDALAASARREEDPEASAALGLVLAREEIRWWRANDCPPEEPDPLARVEARLEGLHAAAGTVRGPVAEAAWSVWRLARYVGGPFYRGGLEHDRIPGRLREGWEQVEARLDRLAGGRADRDWAEVVAEREP